MTARTQAEIRARFDQAGAGGGDYFGFRRDALVDAMEYDTIADLARTPREEWAAPDVAKTAREYLVFAIGKAVDHRGISAGRSIEKLTEWVWCLGDDDLAATFKAADYPMYGAPQLQVLVDAWQVEHEHATNPEWLRMCQGLPCRDQCDAGCGQ